MPPSPEGILYKLPHSSDLAPPSLPPRPDLFDEVEWGSYPTAEEIRKSYLIWKAQDDSLVPEDDRETEVGRRHKDPATCLAHNVYEGLMTNFQLPISVHEQDEDAQYRVSADGEYLEGWTYHELFGNDPGEEEKMEDPHPPLSLKGHSILTDARFWTKARLLPELRSRNLDTVGLVAQLRQRLYDYELESQRSRNLDADKGSILPRQNLSEWGIDRGDDNFMVKITSKRQLSPLDMYTWAITLSPYNPAYWTSRAFLYYQQGHFDLAIGDAYRAQLLCEVLVNPLRRNSQPGLYIRIWDAIERHILQTEKKDGLLPPEIELLRKPNGINHFIPIVRKSIHHLIVLSLLAMQCWEDYDTAESYLRTRLVMADRDLNAIQERRAKLYEFILGAKQRKQEDPYEYLFERHYGSITARPYPYEDDVSKFRDTIARQATAGIFCHSQADFFRPRQLEVKLDSSNRFGVFAPHDIPSGSVIYVDEPSIRGNLHSPIQQASPKHRCENCRREVSPSTIPSSQSTCACGSQSKTPLYWCAAPNPIVKLETSRTVPASGTEKPPKVRARPESGDGDGDSRGNTKKRQRTQEPASYGGPSCLEIARLVYHNRACGRNWDWLHDSMRTNFWADGKLGTDINQYIPGFEDPEEEETEDYGDAAMMPVFSHTNEKHGTILSLLLREVFDITLLRRETQKKPHLLAHEIDELLPIMQSLPDGIPRFPFSFAANVQVPFDILSCLGVNIFRDLTFDTWVVQLVLRKLLLSAVPWNFKGQRKADIPDGPREKKECTEGMVRLNDEKHFRASQTFPDLYVFPAMALFKHGCRTAHNVDWFWDTTVPNRIYFRTVRQTKQGEELLIRYTGGIFTSDAATRVLGESCPCSVCFEIPPTPCIALDIDHYGVYGMESGLHERSPSYSPIPHYNTPTRPAPSPQLSKASQQRTSTREPRKAGDPLPEGKLLDINYQDKTSSGEKESLPDYEDSTQGGSPHPHQHLERYPRGQGIPLSDDPIAIAAKEALAYPHPSPPPPRPSDQGEPVPQQRSPSFEPYESPTFPLSSPPEPPQQQDLPPAGTPPDTNPAPEAQDSSPDYTNLRVLLPGPISRSTRTARVRHRGVDMTAAAFNQIREKEETPDSSSSS
ncbi:hypothetical protein FQN57_004638 [Myotisia sp. PD_48]|nr:hypothetical protein FQN57_004638 [Myotisia sp. PD_48]